MKKKLIEFIKFSFVGGFMTVLNFLLFGLFIEVFNINYISSNIGSYIIAVILSYFLNAKYTFKMTASKEEHLKKLLGFFAMKLILLGLDSLSLYLLVDFLGLNVYISKIALTIFFLFLSYPLSKLIIERK